MAVAVTEAMFSGFICTWPWPMAFAAWSGPSTAGTLPSKETMPVFQSSRPSPNRSCASWVRDRVVSGFSSMSLMKAVLQERRKLLARVAPSFGSMPVRFLKVWLRHTASSVQGAGPFIEVTPLSMSIAAVTIFIVEPGATLPWKAALKPSARWLATASTSPVLGFTATTDDSANPFTAFSAAACTPALSVVRSRPGSPSARVSSGVSAAASPEAPSGWRTTSSTPGVPPASAPYFWRRVSRIGPREGYVSFVSTVPSRSTASMGGCADSSVTRVSPCWRSGCTTDGFQSTSARPVVFPRTTVSSLL